MEPKQNILNFLSSLHHPGSLETFILHPSYPAYVETKRFPYISNTQVQEYKNIKLREILNFLEHHPEIKTDVIGGVVKLHTREPIRESKYLTEDIVMYTLMTRAQNIQIEISDIYRRTAFEFLWNNYHLVEQLKMVDPRFFI